MARDRGAREEERGGGGGGEMNTAAGPASASSNSRSHGSFPSDAILLLRRARVPRKGGALPRDFETRVLSACLVCLATWDAVCGGGGFQVY